MWWPPNPPLRGVVVMTIENLEKRIKKWKT